MRLKAVDELAACDGPAIDGSAQYEVGQLVDPTATVEAVGPFGGMAGQVLGVPTADIPARPTGTTNS